MAKAKQNLYLKIQMLAGKGTKEFFERSYKNLTSSEIITSELITSESITRVIIASEIITFQYVPVLKQQSWNLESMSSRFFVITNSSRNVPFLF